MNAEMRKWRLWREEAWLVLLSVQAPVCAICGRAAEVIDHDHGSGLVRGLLCRGCNGLEKGPGRSHPNHVRYREHPPTEALSDPIIYMDYPGGPEPVRLPCVPKVTWADRLFEALSELGEARPAVLARRLNTTQAMVRAVLGQMQRKQLVRRTPGGWRLVGR